ncbi:EscU/YscU/HrcU family type III secretion system export apparatus switch protein [Pseudacidovorax intermedius]|uniref:EscU/YscU/HrcU family type III secretion system export apparatus switch protein n=1 Tax=Pseudacidovorax intermedius TaxID=433924 RepID=UPI00034BC2CA|nr:EscU/YscU/HrcU family type III secretion system export apparatus switch protein [Pseudacidovorax intermedius]
MSSSSQDKKLPATQRRLDQARRDGQVPRSRDLTHLAVVGTGAVALLLLAPTAFGALRDALAAALHFNAAEAMRPAAMGERLMHLGLLGIAACVGFAAIVIAASVIATLATGGWVMSAKAITPDLNRLNPFSGLGRLFSKQQASTVLKLVLLSAILAGVGFVYVRGSMDALARMVLMPAPSALPYFADWLVQGTALAMLVLVAAAIADVPLQGWLHRSRLRMSHEEVKQEHKETDGNPHVKGQQRKAARAILQRASITAVPRADFVVMNPTHFAVALRYDEADMAAPHVISKGSDLLAMKIRDIAKSHDIPVIQSPMLARALYAHAEIDQPIPSQLFTAVAQILAYVYRLKAAIAGRGAWPQTVPEPVVPAELDPLNDPQAMAALEDEA